MTTKPERRDPRTTELLARLARAIDSHMGPEEKRETPIPGLLLVRRTQSAEPACTTYEPSIAVIAQGRKRVTLGSSTLTYGESRYLLTAVDLPAVGQVIGASPQSPFLALALRIDLATVRELLSREEIAGPPPATPAMSTGYATPEILEAFLRLLTLLDSPRDIPFLADLVTREILYRILQGPQGARLRAISTAGDQSHRTAKAIAWIRANYAQPLRVDHLAQLAGMGVSTFHHHFRALTAMSPLQYQKQLRLQNARTRMLLEGLDAARAAFEVGYESPSQFSREYRRLFGAPPLRDIATLKCCGDGIVQLDRRWRLSKG